MLAPRADQRLTLRLPADDRARLQALARSHGLTESALLKRLIERAIEPVALPPTVAPQGVEDAPRTDRLYVRLYTDDRQLLAERATARGMASATYLAVLARAHLRKLTPLPEAETQALTECLQMFRGLTKHLEEIVRFMQRGGDLVRAHEVLERDGRLFLKGARNVADAVRTILVTNKRSWEVGHDTSDQ